jgi:hypothetical protein
VLIGARFTAAEVVRLAPRRWHVRSAVGAAADRLAHLNLLANAVLSLLRSTVGGIGVEPTLPAHLRLAIHQLTTALGALAEEGKQADPKHGRCRPRRPVRGRGAAWSRHPRAVDASIIQDCVRDLYRVIGAEPER